MNAQAAGDLLKRVHFCVLASSTRDGRPWATPLFFNYGPDLRIVWESEKTSRHSRLLQTNSQVAIVVVDFDSKDPTQSLYLEANAREVPEDGLDEAVRIFWHGPHEKHDRKPLTGADYQGDGPLRLYEAKLESAYSLVQAQVEGGHRVERRSALDLKDLIERTAVLSHD